MRKRPSAVSLLVLAILLMANGALAASECPLNPDGFYTTQEDYLSSKVWCSEFTSRFDGRKDYFFLKFPPNFDKTKPVSVILWFRAYGQSDGAISDARMFNGDPDSGFPGIAALYNAIVIGMGQRGTHSGDNTCNFLGDFTRSEDCHPPAETAASRQAAKDDVAELVYQLSQRFTIKHVFSVGASMGGYASLRLLQLYPNIFSGAITSATALCAKSEGAPPACPGGWLVPGASKAIFDAARAGSFDAKLVYNVVGEKEDNPDLRPANDYLAQVMKGKPLFFYNGRVRGGEHENLFADDYNSKTIHKTAWLTDNPNVVPNLVAGIKNYMATHDRSPLKPPSNWMAPSSTDQSYLTDRMLRGQ